MARVLLYSGGMDSLCTAWLWNYDLLLRIPTNTPYDDAEAQACDRLRNLHSRWSRLKTLTGVFDFSTLEHDNAIVPNRNAYLVLAASTYGNDIHLAAVEGDRSNDKDPPFCGRMEQLLNHTLGRQHWMPHGRGNFTVQLPPLDASLHKSALLQRALDAHMPHEALYISHSCYMPPVNKDLASHRAYGCGVCKPCVRKYVAMVTCGVPIPFFVFKELPRRDRIPWLAEALEGCSRGHVWRCAGEDADFLAVFG